MIKDNRKTHKPREAILKYLQEQLQKDKNNGVESMVIGDTNDDIVHGKRINEFFDDSELYNIIKLICNVLSYIQCRLTFLLPRFSNLILL